MKEIVNRLLFLLPKGDFLKVLALLFLMIIGALMEILGIGAIPGFIMMILDPEKLYSIPILGGVSDEIKNIPQYTLVLYGSLLLAFIFLAKNIFLVFLEMFKAKYVYNRQIYLVNRLFYEYMYAPFSYHLNKNSADYLKNINQEVTLIVNGVVFEVLNFLMNIIFLIGIISLLLVVDVYTTIMSFSVLGFSTWLFLRLTTKKINWYGKMEMKHRSIRNKILMHGIGGIKEIKILQNENFFKEEFENSTYQRTKAMKFKYIINQLPKPFIETIAVVSILIIIVSFSLQGKDLNNIIPIMALYGASAVKILPMLRALVTNYSNVLYNKHAIKPIYEDLIELDKLKKEKSKKNTNGANFSFNEKIEFNDVDFKYPKTEDLILEKFSVEIKKGEVVGVVGKTGSGKTTIVDLLMGLLSANSGKICVDGFDISQHSFAWQSLLGYVPQNIFLADDSIKNNIAYGVREKDINTEALNYAINAAQLKDFLDNLPSGVETIVGERGVRLSGGQRQRIGIARALYQKPSVLILDEATSALDNKTEKGVISAIDYLKGKITLIIIAHRLSTVKKCDKIVVLSKGEIKAVGTYDELNEISSDFKEIASE